MFKRKCALLMPMLCAYVFNGYVSIRPDDTPIGVVNKATKCKAINEHALTVSSGEQSGKRKL